MRLPTHAALFPLAVHSAGGMGVSEDRVELGVELLEKLEHAELPLPDVMDRLETVTTNPSTTRAILDEAEKRGVISRENAVIEFKTAGFVRYESEIVTKEGEFSCQRCGTGLSTGHFIKLESGELGPYGSSCVRKVTGRD